ncbi:MAG: YceH family protein [Burkholderiales bacterium]|nr:YceH family protein [Burkholderiales bacterium]
MSQPPLSPVEARVLAVLFEKQRTTPDIYPLTVNALIAGCNQKSSRHPVMDLVESDVQAALASLKGRTLVMESYGASGRVLRYAHNLPKWLGVGEGTSALLAMLMLRGPQTAAELRANADRLYQFADLSAVEAYLDEMASRKEAALAVRLPRQPGARESRWAHLLCGEPASDAPSVPPARTADDAAALRAELAQLREEVMELRATVERLCAELGIEHRRSES